MTGDGTVTWCFNKQRRKWQEHGEEGRVLYCLGLRRYYICRDIWLSDTVYTKRIKERLEVSESCIISSVLLINYYLCFARVFEGLPPTGKSREQSSSSNDTLTYPCAKPHHHHSPQSTLAALIQCLHKMLGSNDSHETMDHPMSHSLHTILSPTTFHR